MTASLPRSVTLGTALVLALSPWHPPVLQGAEQDAAIEQIRAASRVYVEALNRGDLKAIRNAWTPDGTFNDAAGQSFAAQELAKQEFSSAAEPQQQRMITEHHSTIRLITPTSAIELGTMSSEQSLDPASGKSEFLAVWVKQNDRWLLDLLKEIDVSPAVRQMPLEDLSWMVGEWESKEKETSAHLTVTWSDERSYLLQKFAVQLPGQPVLRGEQRIAWDPSTKQIRCWLFRSDGGFAEGIWSREGDAWVVEKVGVTSAGETTSSVNLWAHEAPGACWFKSLKAKVGDHQGADIILQFTKKTTP